MQDVEGVASNLPTGFELGKEACILAQLDQWVGVNSSVRTQPSQTTMYDWVGTNTH